MNEFISNILSRHLDTVNSIVPRLPGKFESVNSSTANATDFSLGIGTVQEVSLPQETGKAVKEHISETNFTAEPALTTQPGFISGNQVVQQLHNDASIFHESENVDQLSGSKKTIPVKPAFSVDEKINKDPSYEILNKNEMPVHSEIKPVTVNLFNEKPPANNFEQQEMPGSIFINKPDNKDIPAGKEGIFQQHVSILKQKIIKASSERKNNVSEENKIIRTGVIKPLMNDLNLHINLKGSPVTNEQPMSSVIKVSIGRIEVRAITNTTLAKANKTVLQKPNLTLDDYLKRRNGTEK